MTVFVTVFEAADPAISEKKTETMFLRTTDQTTLASPQVIEAAGQRYSQTAYLFYLARRHYPRNK